MTSGFYYSTVFLSRSLLVWNILMSQYLILNWATSPVSRGCAQLSNHLSFSQRLSKRYLAYISPWVLKLCRLISVFWRHKNLATEQWVALRLFKSTVQKQPWPPICWWNVLTWAIIVAIPPHKGLLDVLVSYPSFLLGADKRVRQSITQYWSQIEWQAGVVLTAGSPWWVWLCANTVPRKCCWWRHFRGRTAAISQTHEVLFLWPQTSLEW